MLPTALLGAIACQEPEPGSPGPFPVAGAKPEQCGDDEGADGCAPEVPEPELPQPKGMPQAEETPFVVGSTVLAVLPDTQFYSLKYPSIFTGQTAFLAENAEALNIAYVFHLGDIVDLNTPEEWRTAREAMRLLDGVVPYALATGNHDYGKWGTAVDRTTGLNEWFSYGEFAALPSFGGAYEEGRLENTYHLFEAGGHAWIAMVLEWGPRDEVVAWADSVMEEHPDRLGILVTHAYLNYNDRRYDHTDKSHPQDYNPHWYGTAGGVNDGEELWQKLVRRHHFVLVLSGHVLEDGTGYLASRNDFGDTVHQLMSNYQMRDLGGEGFMRLLELLPDGKTMVVRTYSPTLDTYLRGPDQNFTIELDVD